MIEPYTLAIEDNYHQGKTLKAASLAEAYYPYHCSIRKN